MPALSLADCLDRLADALAAAAGLRAEPDPDTGRGVQLFAHAEDQRLGPAEQDAPRTVLATYGGAGRSAFPLDRVSVQLMTAGAPAADALRRACDLHAALFADGGERTRTHWDVSRTAVEPAGTLRVSIVDVRPPALAGVDDHRRTRYSVNLAVFFQLQPATNP